MTVTSNSIVRSSLYAVGAIIAFVNPQAADAAKVSPLSIGAWKGGAYSNSSTGSFSHCAVSAKYKNGMSFLISVTGDKKWSVGFANDAWNLSVGSKQPVRFKVDDGSSYSSTATARTKFLAQVELPASKRLFDQFRDGQRFYVKTRKSSFSFNLTNVARVLPTLVRCARHNASIGNDPFGLQSSVEDSFDSRGGWAKPRKKPVKRGPTRRTRQEAFTAVSYMLGKAKVRAQYIDPAINPELLSKNDIAWSMNDTIGTFRILPSARDSAEADRDHIIQTDAKVCIGKFVSHTVASADAGSLTFMTVCNRVRGADNSLGMAVFYSLLPRREGGKYLLSVVGKIKNHEHVRETGTRLNAAAVALNHKGSVPGARSVSY